jgi:hypothetical protein
LPAIEWRFEALARLDGRPELQAWSLPTGDAGATKIDPLVLRAAAEEPLITGGERATFDPDSFFKRLLTLSGESGRG